jgi:hypothetical protein
MKPLKMGNESKWNQILGKIREKDIKWNEKNGLKLM